jgi:hypothetical protein
MNASPQQPSPRRGASLAAAAGAPAFSTVGAETFRETLPLREQSLVGASCNGTVLPHTH